ncbi:TPA: hypothetical protein MW242_003091 [Acinetobacter baumannii]|nr:hypothetical protein [Acinetobacter baumannii]
MKTEDLEKLQTVANVDYASRLSVKGVSFASKNYVGQAKVENFKAPELKPKMPTVLS